MAFTPHALRYSAEGEIGNAKELSVQVLAEPSAWTVSPLIARCGIG